MLERSAAECTRGRIAFRRTERRGSVRPPTSILPGERGLHRFRSCGARARRRSPHRRALRRGDRRAGRSRHRVRRRHRRRARALRRLRRARSRSGIRARRRHGLPHLLHDQELRRHGRALVARRGQARHRHPGRCDRARPAAAGRGRAGCSAPDGATAADDGRRTAAGRPLGGSPDGPRQRLGERRGVRARGDALARSRYGLRVLQLRLGRARARDRGGHRAAPPGRRARARAGAARLALDGLECRRPAAGAGRDRVPRGRRRFRGGSAAVRRRLLLRARRPLQQRARPGPLERGVPRRRTAAGRAARRLP